MPSTLIISSWLIYFYNNCHENVKLKVLRFQSPSVYMMHILCLKESRLDVGKMGNELTVSEKPVTMATKI